MTRWKVRGTRLLYESEVVRLELADVELTDGSRVDHHVIRIPFEVVSLVVWDGDRGVLLIWRYRFITNRWTWDVPAGRVAPGEAAADAAARAAIDETGWRPAPVRLLGMYHPTPGMSDQRFGVYVADTAEQVAEPDPNEVERVEWVPVDRVRDLLRAGEVDGVSLTSLLWALSA
jgi:8-oxo-dGTP pyrophosphatase MutT (NUDIX family)